MLVQRFIVNIRMIIVLISVIMYVQNQEIVFYSQKMSAKTIRFGF